MACPGVIAVLPCSRCMPSHWCGLSSAAATTLQTKKVSVTSPFKRPHKIPSHIVRTHVLWHRSVPSGFQLPDLFFLLTIMVQPMAFWPFPSGPLYCVSFVLRILSFHSPSSPGTFSLGPSQRTLFLKEIAINMHKGSF